MLNIEQVVAKTEALKREAGNRDARMELVRDVRNGNYNFVGDMFPESWPKPVVANFIDVAAHDVAEVLAPLPTISAAMDMIASDRSRNRADKCNKILSGYVRESRLETRMYTAGDRYATYGFMALRVEPDFENHRPRIVVDEVLGGYPEFDRLGKTVSYTKRWRKSELQLAALFPEYRNEIAGVTPFGEQKQPSENLIELVQYHDGDQTVCFVPERKNLVLDQYANPVGKCLIRAARRPTVDDDLRGQFDDVLWVQLARSKFAMLALEAAHQAVRAPIALPNDVQEIAFGENAVIRSATPEKIGRVNIQVPREAFMAEQTLAQEQRIGARYPETRTGTSEAGVITGRGVQELSSGFDSQIRAAQQIFAEVLVEIFGLCLEMDEKLWPDESKTVRGVRDGTPYETTYIPSRDINGSYKVDVTYGQMQGLDPNRALVFALQTLGAGLVSMDWVRRNLPGVMNVSQEETQIDVEKMRAAVQEAIMAFAQAIPALAQSGQDPSPVLVKMAEVIHARQAGTPIEDAVAQAFAPQPPPSPAGSEAPPADSGAPGAAAGGGMTSGGLMPSGLMQGVPPGQAGLPPGGRPALQDLLAGLSSRGTPNLGASVIRRTPAA